VALCVGSEAALLCSRKLDIVVAVDVSGSTSSSDFNKQVAFLREVVNAIKVSSTIGARIIVFGFDHNMNSLASSFLDRETRFKNLVQEQISSLTLTAGATTIDGAIVQVKEFFNTTTRKVPRRVVFLTDGVNYGGSESLRIPAEELRTLFGAKVIGLGVGPTNTINIEAFEILTGRKDRHFILTFKKKKSCAGGDDSDCECSEDSDGEEDSDNEGCSISELKKAVNLICS